MTDKIELFMSMVKKSDNIVFFGGAGVSTESGIPDFRSEDGLYRVKYSYPPETILSHDFFFSHTDEFYKFYFDKMIYTDAEPNAAHKALAKLERMGKLKAIVTQNIDNLHQMAGSKNVLELHGSVYRNRCTRCNRFFSLTDMLDKQEDIPHCDCGGIIKPMVVLYGENLDDEVVEKSVEYISRADMLIVGGTSLNVYPAAGLLRYYNKDKLVLINKTATPFDKNADLVINEPIGEVFSSLGL